MNIETVKTRTADWMEREVVMKYYKGAELYVMLFALPFKLKELEYKLEDNRDMLEQWGLIKGSDIDLDKLEEHAICAMDKCGALSMDVGSKTLTVKSSDVRALFNYVRGCEPSITDVTASL